MHGKNKKTKFTKKDWLDGVLELSFPIFIDFSDFLQKKGFEIPIYLRKHFLDFRIEARYARAIEVWLATFQRLWDTWSMWYTYVVLAILKPLRAS